MKCAKVALQERSRARVNTAVMNEKPRRYCEKRLVNPRYEEDPRWTIGLERYYCKEIEATALNECYDSGRLQQDNEDLFLSVQNLQFQGEVQQSKRPRTSFKYKTSSDKQTNRMFVKELIEEVNNDPGRSSELTCYYYDDYAKYLDRSRNSSEKSSLIFATNKSKENKAIQTQVQPTKCVKNEQTKKTKKSLKRDDTSNVKVENVDSLEKAQISFHKCGKTKSITLTRNDSPATVQVIRVDVVCNQSGSSIYDDKKQSGRESGDVDNSNSYKIDSMKHKHYANKYLLTNTVKTLDQNACGAKVTLLCKTFKLADRSRVLSERRTKYLRESVSGYQNDFVSLNNH